MKFVSVKSQMQNHTCTAAGGHRRKPNAWARGQKRLENNTSSTAEMFKSPWKSRNPTIDRVPAWTEKKWISFREMDHACLHLLEGFKGRPGLGAVVCPAESSCKLRLRWKADGQSPPLPGEPGEGLQWTAGKRRQDGKESVRGSPNESQMFFLLPVLHLYLL